MATLPADRTKLALAQSNQNPLNVLGSSQNKNALTEAYDTIDTLYNYTTGLISAGTLSKLGVINVKDYNASGLATTAVGSITTGTKVLTLTTTPDFVAGQGINLQGAMEASSLQVTGAATVSSNVTVTLNGVAFPVAVVNGDTAIQVATKIRAATYAGWTAGGTAGTDTVTFTSTTTGTKTDATYSAGTTGSTAIFTTTVQGTNDQISTVSSVSGLVVNIADNATRTISSGAIYHDDTNSIQAAVDASALNGGKLYIPAGVYNISQPIRFGVSADGATVYRGLIIEGSGYGTKIVYNFSSTYSGRAAFEFGKQTALINQKHMLRNMYFANAQGTPNTCYAVRIYNAYGFVMDNVECRTYNCLDIMRNGTTGYTTVNVLISNCFLYAGYYAVYSGGAWSYEVPESPIQARYCVNNTGTHRWDDVHFRNCGTNALNQLAGTIVTVENCQFYNNKRTAWTYTQTGYAFPDASTFCIYFTEGSLVLKNSNFEVYQNAVGLGLYGYIVEDVLIEVCNFNGISYDPTIDYAANAIVLLSGGTGYTRNVSIKKCMFQYNQKSDIIVDNTGNNSNGIPYVSDVFVENCKSLDSPFSSTGSTLTVSASQTVTLSNGALSKQFRGVGAKIIINGTTYYILSYPDANSLMIDTAITVSGVSYSRTVQNPIRKTGDSTALTASQVKFILNNDTVDVGYYYVGDELRFKTFSSGGYAGQLCVNSGRLHNSVGDTTNGSQNILNVTNIRTWTSGDPVKGSGITAGAIVSNVDVTNSKLTITIAATATATGVELYESRFRNYGAIL